MSKQVVQVGKRTYNLEVGKDGRWVVSRGGIPTGYLHVLANGETAAFPLASEDGASEELLAVLEVAKKESWWR